MRCPSLARLRPLFGGALVLSGLVLGLRALLARRQQAGERAQSGSKRFVEFAASWSGQPANRPAIWLPDSPPRCGPCDGSGLADDAGRALVERLETESYAPSAAGRPLSDDLRAEIAGLLDRWSKLPAPPSAKGRPRR